MLRLPSPCLVVLVGPSGAGKSSWADEQFAGIGPGVVVSSDRIRAMVGDGEHDQRAGKDAFDVIDLVVERRLRRRLLTVVDTLGYDRKHRRRWIALARRHGVPCYAITFDVDADVARARNRARNRARGRAVPRTVHESQLTAWPKVLAALADDGFDAVHNADAVHVVPRPFLEAPAYAHRQREQPMPLSFGLHVSSFTWPGGPAEIGERLAATAEAAEAAGFDALTVMDHFIQIPAVGRHWEDMLDSYTTLAFVAGRTRSLRLGVLVTGVTYRNIAHLGKIVATLDVLSGGRAFCGIGAAWFEREHRAYGWRFPPLGERFDRLEDALRLLPMLWGPGSPSFEGKTMTVPEAICYPRPLQDKVPILVGGSGERRTLRLVAEYADACNLFGDADTVRRKVDVLRKHCDDLGRDPAEVTVTQLSTARVAASTDAAGDADAATVDDHIGRFRQLAEAGVQQVFVSLPDLGHDGAVERFGEVIAAFR